VRSIILFLLPMFFLGAAKIQNEEEYFAQGPAPEWVVATDCSHEGPSTLLIDTQYNLQEKTIYQHRVVKILSRTGADAFTQLDFEFNPSHHKVIVHAIRVLRDGTWSDRLENAHYHLIQQEKKLHDRYFLGNLTLLYLLDDLRPGDILDYSLSFIENDESPTFQEFAAFKFQHSFPVGKIFYRLLTDTRAPVSVKAFNTSIEPLVRDYSSSLQEWIWEASDIPRCSSDDDAPNWYNPCGCIQMSKYQNWKEAVERLIPIYSLSEAPSMELMEYVKQWQGEPKERALQALRFVQDQIKYFSLADKREGGKPWDPVTVLKRRYGNCLDKTFLLHVFLRLMDIPSTLVLVDTNDGKIFPDLLPVPFGFNHVILRIEIDGENYWVDPTDYLQGGALQDVYFPNYGWGLPVSKDTTDLVRLPDGQVKHPTEIETYFTVRSPDEASIGVTFTYYGYEADMKRQFLDREGKEALAQKHLGMVKRTYGNATFSTPLAFTDDREKNILTVTEEFSVPTRKRGYKKGLEVFSIINRSYRSPQVDRDRSSPYEIEYPLWVKEHIHIENPFYVWDPDLEELIVDQRSLFYSESMKKEGENSTDLYFELKHIQDHVPQEDISEFWEIIDHMEDNTYFKMTIR